MLALDMLVDLIGYTVARALLRSLSFGRIYVQPFSAVPERLIWPGCRRDEIGRIELHQTVAGWIGLGICFIMLLAIGLIVGGFVRHHPT